MLVHAWDEAGPRSRLVHDLIGAFDPHGDDIRTFVRLEDEAGDAPFEVAHHLLRVLMDSSFGEDVDPGILSGVVGGGGGEGVDAVGGVCVGMVW